MEVASHVAMSAAAPTAVRKRTEQCRKRRCGKADDEHRQELDTTRERMTHRRATREQLLDRFRSI